MKNINNFFVFKATEAHSHTWARSEASGGGGGMSFGSGGGVRMGYDPQGGVWGLAGGGVTEKRPFPVVL